jgi:hypothetical protein
LRKFISYNTTQWLPWWIQRYVFQNKNAKLEPLYHFHGVAGEKEDEKRAVSIHEATDRKDPVEVKE